LTYLTVEYYKRLCCHLSVLFIVDSLLLFSPNPYYSALLASLLFLRTASFYLFFNTSFLSLRFMEISTFRSESSIIVPSPSFDWSFNCGHFFMCNK